MCAVVTEPLTAAIASGATNREAARTVGVSERAVYAWLRRGLRGERPYAAFAAAYVAARTHRRRNQGGPNGHDRT